MVLHLKPLILLHSLMLLFSACATLLLCIADDIYRDDIVFTRQPECLSWQEELPNHILVSQIPWQTVLQPAECKRVADMAAQ